MYKLTKTHVEYFRYNEEREDPELPRNMPPVSGRVMWIRFYDKNIKTPMEIFKHHHEVITHMVSCTYTLVKYIATTKWSSIWLNSII